MTVRARLVAVFTALLTATIALVASINTVQTQALLSDRLTTSEIPNATLRIRNQISGDISRYVHASFGLADSAFLRDWFAAGEPESGLDTWKRHAEAVRARYGAFNVSFVSNVTRRYYDQTGHNVTASGAIQFWFDPFLASNAPYEVVLDRNVTTGNQFKIFTNVRVDVGGKLASVGLGVDAEALAARIASARIGESGQVYLVEPSGRIKVHADDALIGTGNIRALPGIEAVASQLLPTNPGLDAVQQARFDGEAGEILVSSAWLPEIGAFVVLELPADEVFAPVVRALLNSVWIGILILGAAILVVLLVARQMTRPLSQLTQSVEKVAAGALDDAVPAQARRDEIGSIARAIEQFRESLVAKRELEIQQARAEADRLTEKRHLMMQLADRFEERLGRLVKNVSSTAEGFGRSAIALAGQSNSAREQAKLVRNNAEEASTNVEAVAAATEELTVSSREISSQVSRAAKVARAAVQEAERASDNVRQLAEAADRIGAVVLLITEIAEKTNLLALNATIEAARAGEAGKGFAVVASEVKGLANQTAKATGDIRTQIEDIQQSTGTATKSISEISVTIREIDEISSSVAAAVEEQTAATQEIARNVEQAAGGANRVTENIRKVNESTTEVSGMAGDLEASAGQLSQTARDLQKDVETLVREIREQP